MRSLAEFATFVGIKEQPRLRKERKAGIKASTFCLNVPVFNAVSKFSNNAISSLRRISGFLF